MKQPPKTQRSLPARNLLSQRHCLPLAVLLAACSGGAGNGVTANPAAGPQFAGLPTYLDRNGNGDVDQGDEIVLHFDQQVSLRGATPEHFPLAVPGDSYGRGARVMAGALAHELCIVLGDRPHLSVRGTFAPGMATPGAPSGLGMDASAGIVTTSTQVPPVPIAPGDIAPGMFGSTTVLGTAKTRAIVAGDLDGDGDLDLVTGNEDGADVVWFNDGHGSFTAAGQQLGNGTTQALALGDLDGDGDLDLVSGNDRQANEVWQNDGHGAFTAAQTLPAARTQALSLGDLDGDGDLDLVTGNGNGRPQQLWWNNGSGEFAAGPEIGRGNSHVTVLADIDGDGDLDLLVGGSGPNAIWRNDGGGTFVELPQTIGHGNTRGLAVGDVDCDGDVDVVVAGRDPSWVWHNDGHGAFAPSRRLVNAATDAVRLGDLDGDGRLDVFAANANGQPDQVWFLDAAGDLHDSGQRLGDATTTDAVLGDFDRDGDLDVATAGFGAPSRVWFNSLSHGGAISFREVDARLGEGPALQLGTGDFDRDGDLDVAETNGPARGTAIWHNDGNSHFPARQLLGGTAAATAVADLDRDGDLDLLEFGPGQALQRWSNDGTGNLVGPTAVAPSTGVALALGDADGDGDLDLLLCRGNQGPAELWLGSASGFALSPLLLPADVRTAVFADLDRDGDQDLVLGTATGAELWRQDAAVLSYVATVTQDAIDALAAVDLDRDGDLDLGAAGANGWASWSNDGSGSFPNAGPLQGSATRALTLGDVDRDGDLDLVRGGDSGVELWWNDGSGGFTASSVALFGGPTNDLRLVDLGCNGDLDLLIADGSATGGLRVWLQD